MLGNVNQEAFGNEPVQGLPHGGRACAESLLQIRNLHPLRGFELSGEQIGAQRAVYLLGARARGMQACHGRECIGASWSGRRTSEDWSSSGAYEHGSAAPPASVSP